MMSDWHDPDEDPTGLYIEAGMLFVAWVFVLCCAIVALIGYAGW
jgi:hypothetical protein